MRGSGGSAPPADLRIDRVAKISDVLVEAREVFGALHRSRQQSLAIRWMVDNSRKKKGKPMAQRLAEEIVDAYNGTGASVQWKENVHKMAEANKAYAHYA